MANYAKKTVAETEEQTVVKKASSEKPSEKKTVKKRAARKTTAVESKVYIQFFGKQISSNDVLTSCEADYKSNNKAAVKSIEVYVKPEDNTAYYVVNGETEGKISL